MFATHLCRFPGRLGGRILPRYSAALAAVLSLAIADTGASQAVVAPGAAYVEAPSNLVAATAARWRLDADATRTLRVAFGPPRDGQRAREFWAEARRALDAWSAIPGLPLRFELVGETERADVEFRWIERFPLSQAGATRRQLGEDGYIDHVTVVLARSHSDGTPMSAEFRRLVALHEVGHVLGLPHSEHPGDVMHAGNRSFEISPRDLRSLGNLYGRPMRPE